MKSMDAVMLRLAHGRRPFCSFALAILLLTTACLTGCNSAEEPKFAVSSGTLKTPSEPLTQADIDKFLMVVRAHPKQRAPEFTAADREKPLDPQLSAELLIPEFRARFRELFDPQRQGELWAYDTDWSKILKAQQVPPDELAALAGSISCAITRVRVDSRFDLQKIIVKARSQIEDLAAQMDRMDKIPAAERTRELALERARAIDRLGRSVALLEFAELLRDVPKENQTLVRKYSAELKRFLPQQSQSDPFAELQEWDGEAVVPAGYEK